MRYMGYNITMSAPSRRQPSAAAAQRWGSASCMRSQPLYAERGGVASERFELLPQRGELLLCLRVGRHDRHPAIAKPGRARYGGVRRTAEPDRDRTLHGRRHDADVLEVVEAPIEAHEVLRPKATEHLNLFGLARSARLPLRAERFILDMVPSQTDAEPQASPAQEIDLHRLLGDDPGLALRRDQNAAGEPDILGDRCQKAERHKGLVKRILLVVQRNPAIPRRRSEDVIGDFDIGVAEILCRLRPITDLRGIAADIKRREEGIELHVGPPRSGGRSLSSRSLLNSRFAFARG